MNEHCVHALIDKTLFQKPRWFVSLLIIVLCFLAYANAINHPFVHDDIIFIEQNPHIHELDLKSIFTATANPAGDNGLVNAYWRPGLELFTRLQYRLFGLTPAPYHATNVLLHGLNGILLYLLLLKLPLKGKPLALGVALVFLLHPIQSEPVACVSGISNVLLAFFMFSSLFFYLDWIEKGGTLRVVCCLGAVSLALLTKEQAVVIPAVFLTHYVILIAPEKKKGAGLIAGAFAVTALYFVLRALVTGTSVTSRISLDMELVLRLASIPRTLLIYVRSLLFPMDLHYYRNLDILAPKVMPAVLFTLVLAAVLMVVFKMRTERRLAAFALGWFILCLLPMLNIVPLINEYSLILTADHFLYIPIVGFALFVLLALKELLRINAFFKRTAFILMCLFYLSMTVYLNRFWAAEVPLFERTVRYQKNFARGHYLLGKAYYFDRQFEKSIASFEAALRIMQGYQASTPDEKAKAFYDSYIKSIHFDTAHSYAALGRQREAIGHYEEALVLDAQDGAVLNNLGLAYINLGDPAAAENYFEQALALNPEDQLSGNNLATLYAIQGREQEALAIFEALLEKDPNNPATVNNYNHLRARTQGAAGFVPLKGVK